jgi:transcriptional regulator with XRE-family HTH domain
VKRKESGGKFAVTPSQVRAARGLLGWSREQLSAASGVPTRTLDRLEAEVSERPREATMKPLVDALAAAGIEFLDGNGGGPGVRFTREAAIQIAVEKAKGKPTGADAGERSSEPAEGRQQRATRPRSQR